MSLRLNFNASVSATMRHMAEVHQKRTDTMEQISSSRRLTRAKHDPAGSAVASNLDATQRSKRQALRNLNDGLSMLGVAEGGLNEIGDMVSRMRELAVQSSSETLAQSERAYLQDEYEQLSAEITRAASTTTWGDRLLLAYPRVEIGFIVDASSSMGQEFTAVKTSLPNFKQTLSDAGIDFGLGLVENSARDTVDSTAKRADIADGRFLSELSSLTTVNGLVDPWAAMQNASGVNDEVGTLEEDTLGWTRLAKKKLLINITDTSREVDKITGTETQQDVANNLLAAGVEVHSIHRPANNGDYSTITSTTGGDMYDIGDNLGSGIGTAMNAIATRVGALYGERGVSIQASDGDTAASQIDVALPVNATAGGLELDVTSVETIAEARDALEAIDVALDRINEYRSSIGAYTNRVESAIRLETTSMEQTTVAQSRIEDLDMAKATAKIAKFDILHQASVSVLGQARGINDMALRLIQ